MSTYVARNITAAMLATAAPVPLYRSVPVAFRHAPPLKAPKRATEEQKQAVREARRKHNLGTLAAAELKRLRLELDHSPGGRERLLINSVDGGFANRTYLGAVPERTAVVARIRKDARFRAFLPLPQRRGSRKYGPDLRDLIQAYFARWQIEVSFRDEKSLLGLGEAQLWHPESVHRGPALLVACYSCLLLASIIEFGDRRTAALEPLPRWRSDRPTRPSTRELIRTLRAQAGELQPSTVPRLPAAA